MTDSILPPDVDAYLELVEKLCREIETVIVKYDGKIAMGSVLGVLETIKLNIHAAANDDPHNWRAAHD